MPRTARPAIREKDITGLKDFDQLAPLLERLHDDACGRDTAGNRTLHFDQYAMLMLLYFFNPIVTSLRGLRQVAGAGATNGSEAPENARQCSTGSSFASLSPGPVPLA